MASIEVANCPASTKKSVLAMYSASIRRLTLSSSIIIQRMG